MSRKTVYLAAAGASVLALTFVPACGSQEPAVAVTGAAPQLAGVDSAPVDERVLDYLSQEDLPGATVAVTKNSRLVWSKGYGYADAAAKTPMQPENRSKIGSVSKILTTIGALALMEDGALALDQHVYGSGAAPLWGSDPGATPGVVFASDGVLPNLGDYFDAMVAGVDNVGEYFPPADHLDEWPSLAWAQLNQAAYEQAIATTLDRASGIQVGHLLSHTAGLARSTQGAKEAAAEHFDTTETDLSYEQLHQGVLMGMADAGAPFVLDPGSQWKYSNIGFMLAGHIIAVASDDGDYRQYIEHQLLWPLGLFDVVPNNASITHLDALPHDSENVPYPLDPDSVSRLLLATGGWSASARDLARVMCSIDSSSNHLRSLEPATVELMAADAAPYAAGLNPLGWDSHSDGELTKNGDIDGGSARITKFLPGAIDHSSGAEINVAVLTNKGDSVPSTQLLRDIAELVAEADIPADYDLFDPAFGCYVEPSLSVAAEPPAPTPAAEPTTDDPDAATDSDRRTPVDRSPFPEDNRTPTGPVIIDLRTDPSRLWEQWRAGQSCGRPARATVVAGASAPSALRSVTIGWQAGEEKGSRAMSDRGSGVWSGELGPFGADTVPATEDSVPVSLIVTATDGAGQTATVETVVTVHQCEPIVQR